jgi:uncharacterized lipoprotein YmbA
VMRVPRLLLFVACVATLLPASGCLKRTKISETYVLDAVAAREAPTPSEAPEAVVGVLRVGVPGWIDRPQLSARTRSSRSGPLRRVVAAPWPPNEIVDQRVDVTLSEAARQADGSVLVEARWALLGATGTTLVQRRTSHRAHPTAAGAAGAVEGVNEALAELSREIAAALRSLPPRPGSSDRASQK